MNIVFGKEAYTDEQIREMWPRFLEESFSKEPWVPKLIVGCDGVDVVRCARMHDVVGLIELIRQTGKDRLTLGLNQDIFTSLVPEDAPERWYDKILYAIRRKLEIPGYGFIRESISTEDEPLRRIVFLRSFVHKLSKEEIPELSRQERDDFEDALNQLYSFLERNYCTYEASYLKSIYYDLVRDLPPSQREYIDWYCSSGPRIIEWPCFPWPKNYKLYLSPEEERKEEALYCNLVVCGFPKVKEQIERIIATDKTKIKSWDL